MNKVVSMLLAIVLLALPASVFADTAFTMAGYDGSAGGHDWNNNFFFLRMEERTGLNFIYQQSGEEADWKAVKQQLLQGENLPDVLFKAELPPQETLALYEKGVLIDLTPYLAENAPNLCALFEEHPEWKQAVTLPNGAIVALPYLNTLQSNNAIWINTVWLNNVGLQMPETPDEFAGMLRAFKTEDPNHNGKRDEIPLTFTGMWDLRFLAHAFGITSNDYYVSVQNGTVVETVTSDENRAFLTWLHGLYAEGLIDHSGFTTGQVVRQETDSDATICFGVVFGPSVLTMLPNSQINNYDVMLPLTCNGQQVYRDLFGDVVRGTFAVTSACSDPAAMIRWVDYLYSEEGCYLAQAGLLNEEYERHSDGTWSWIDDTQHVVDVILPEYTIAEGGVAPGYTPLSYQLTYDDAGTHRTVEQLQALKEKSVQPYPMVYLTADQQQRMDAIWAKVGLYAETAMARFVTGDVPLNDDTWNEFCQTLEQMGLNEAVAIWQEAMN